MDKVQKYASTNDKTSGFLSAISPLIFMKPPKQLLPADIIYLSQG
jgi:hypothetical protein